MQMNRRKLVSGALALATVVPSASAWAQSSSADSARGLQAEAMQGDFLNTNFKAAEKKLKKAIKTCKNDCSDELRAELHRDLGILYMAGMSRPKNGRTEVEKALKLDPDLPFDGALLSSEVKKQILEAGANPATLLHDPPQEAAVGYPVALSVDTLGSVSLAEAWVVFRRIGEGRWQELQLREGVSDYAGYLPCDVVEEPGSIEYFLELREGTDIIASAYSSAEPEALTVASDSDVLSLPGEPAPDACSADDETEDDDAEADERKIWVQGGIQQDFALVGGRGMCTATGQTEAGYYCFSEQGQQYTGTPDPNRPSSVNSALVAATTRFLMGVDYLVSDSVSIGGSVGFATGGGPAPVGGTAFVPVHLEGRGAYWFVGERALPTSGFGMYGVGAVGFAQLDAKVNAIVTETDASGVARRQRMVVWRKMGRQFVAAGAGGFLPLGTDAEYGAVRLEARYMLMLLDTGSALSPSLSYAYGF